MDMTKFTKGEDRLARHTGAIRDHQISVALMFLYLNGYDVELHYVGRPLASAAQEVLDELGYEGIPIWSQAPTKGGVFTTWQREALKTGTVPETRKWREWLESVPASAESN